MYRDPSFLDLLFFLAVAGFLAYSVAKDRLSADQTPEERLREQYADGEIDEVGDEYKADIKTRIEATLRESDGELEVEKMDAQMTEEYAEAAYLGALRWLKHHGDVDVRRGKYVRH